MKSQMAYSGLKGPGFNPQWRHEEGKIFSFVFGSTACHSRRRSTGGNVSVSCWRNDIRSVSTDSSYSLVLSLQKYAPRPSVCLSVTPQLTVFMYCTIYLAAHSVSQSVKSVKFGIKKRDEVPVGKQAGVLLAYRVFV